jgi:hypothetical protein
MQIRYTLTLEWPTLVLGPRSRHSQLLKPWPVVINLHVLKLGAKTGHHTHFRAGVSGRILPDTTFSCDGLELISPVMAQIT